jgi:hypothetical protein
VLCDAGGGTVDLISYEIMKLNPLEVKELVHGTGRQKPLPMHHIHSLIGTRWTCWISDAQLALRAMGQRYCW